MLAQQHSDVLVLRPCLAGLRLRLHGRLQLEPCQTVIFALAPGVEPVLEPLRLPKGRRSHVSVAPSGSALLSGICPQARALRPRPDAQCDEAEGKARRRRPEAEGKAGRRRGNDVQVPCVHTRAVDHPTPAPLRQSAPQSIRIRGSCCLRTGPWPEAATGRSTASPGGRGRGCGLGSSTVSSFSMVAGFGAGRGRRGLSRGEEKK
jgi:hypothetical protein